MLRIWITLLLSLTCEAVNRGPWSLPSVGISKRPEGRDFLQECESLILQLRAGGEDDDDYYHQQDDYYYDDRGQSPSSRSQSSSSSSVTRLLKQGDKRIGTMLLGSGLAITMVGVSLFFNKTLMRLGNLLLVAGIPMFLGPTRVIGYFGQAHRWRASACLAMGIFLVFIGWPVFGMALEVFGVLNLFGNMFPLVKMFMKQMPVVGNAMKSDQKRPPRPDDYYRRREEDDYRDSPDEYYQDDYGRENNDSGNDRYGGDSNRFY